MHFLPPLRLRLFNGYRFGRPTARTVAIGDPIARVSTRGKIKVFHQSRLVDPLTAAFVTLNSLFIMARNVWGAGLRPF